MLLSEALSAMLATRMAKRTDATKAFRAEHVPWILEAIGDLDVREVGYVRILAWVEAMRLKGLNGQTIIKRLTTLRLGLFESLCRGELDAMPPFPPVDADYRPREEYLTRPEYRTLRMKLKPHRRLWLDLGVFTGMHVSDINGMTWRDVEVRDGKTWWLRKNSKNSTRPLWVEAEPEFAEALRGAAQSDLGHIVKPWDRASRDLTKAAGRGLAPIDLRRTRASWLAEEGAPLDIIRAVLGHSSDSAMAVRTYIRVTPDRLASWRKTG